jgi:hypothetical protein
MSRAPKTLYHLTCRACWHFIKDEGITMGEVPLSPTEILQHPNLTSNPEPAAQKWARVGETATKKTAVRIAVEIPPGDGNLISWRDFAARHGVDRRWYRCLDEVGGWVGRKSKVSAKKGSGGYTAELPDLDGAKAEIHVQEFDGRRHCCVEVFRFGVAATIGPACGVGDQPRRAAALRARGAPPRCRPDADFRVTPGHRSPVVRELRTRPV